MAFFDGQLVLAALKPLKVKDTSAYDRHRDLAGLVKHWIAAVKEVYIVKVDRKSSRLKHPIGFSDGQFLKAMKQAYGLPLEGRNGHYAPIQAASDHAAPTQLPGEDICP